MITFCPSSVCQSVNTFTFSSSSLEPLANFNQILHKTCITVKACNKEAWHNIYGKLYVSRHIKQLFNKLYYSINFFLKNSVGMKKYRILFIDNWELVLEIEVSEGHTLNRPWLTYIVMNINLRSTDVYLKMLLDW